MLAVAYARVSTEDQVKHGYSLEGQVQECLKRAQELGLKTDDVKVIKDEGLSGSILERPGLMECISLIQKGFVQYFIVYDPDRLSRKTAHQLYLVELIEKYECELIYTNYEWSDSPEGKLFYTIRSAIAEYEKAKILLRTKFGRLSKAKQGKLTHDPHTFGYSYVKGEGRLELDEDQASLYLRMIDMVTAGYTPEKIADVFNTEKQPSPKGGRWYRGTVRRILRNKIYTGTLNLNKYNHEGLRVRRQAGEHGNYKVRPEAEWIPIKLDKNLILITEDDWNEVQRILDGQRTGKRGTKVYDYLLSGVAYCGECGKPLNGIYTKSHGKMHKYYVCSGRRIDKEKLIQNEKCKLKHIRANEIEEIVWNTVKGWVLEPEEFIEHLKNSQERVSYDKEKSQLQKKLSSLDKEKDKNKIMFKRDLVGIEELEVELKKIDGKISTINERLNEINQQEKLQDEMLSKIDGLKEIANEVADIIDVLEFSDKQVLVKKLVNRVIVFNEDVPVIETRLIF